MRKLHVAPNARILKCLHQQKVLSHLDSPQLAFQGPAWLSQQRHESHTHTHTHTKPLLGFSKSHAGHSLGVPTGKVSRPSSRWVRQSCFSCRPWLALCLLVQSDVRRLKVFINVRWSRYGLQVRKVVPWRNCLWLKAAQVVTKQVFNFLQVFRRMWLCRLLLLFLKVRRVLPLSPPRTAWLDESLKPFTNTSL